jgi:hypothetical protein
MRNGVPYTFNSISRPLTPIDEVIKVILRVAVGTAYAASRLVLVRRVFLAMSVEPGPQTPTRSQATQPQQPSTTIKTSSSSSAAFASTVPTVEQSRATMLHEVWGPFKNTTPIDPTVFLQQYLPLTAAMGTYNQPCDLLERYQAVARACPDEKAMYEPLVRNYSLI